MNRPPVSLIVLMAVSMSIYAYVLVMPKPTSAEREASLQRLQDKIDDARASYEK